MRSSCSAAVRVFAGLLVLCALSQSLVVTKFPHFQTFDSWDECSYAGTCYEKECINLPAGWANVPIEAVEFYNQSRNWWITEGQTSSNVDWETRNPLTCSEVRALGSRHRLTASRSSFSGLTSPSRCSC